MPAGLSGHAELSGARVLSKIGLHRVWQALWLQRQTRSILVAQIAWLVSIRGARVTSSPTVSPRVPSHSIAGRYERCSRRYDKNTRLNSSHPSISYAVFCL